MSLGIKEGVKIKRSVNGN